MVAMPSLAWEKQGPWGPLGMTWSVIASSKEVYRSVLVMLAKQNKFSEFIAQVVFEIQRSEIFQICW